MGDKPKPKFFSRLSSPFRLSHENRSTASLPPPLPSVPVAAQTPSPDPRSRSVSNLHDDTSDSPRSRFGFRKALSNARDFVTGRRARPGAAISSPTTTSLASASPGAPTSRPPGDLPSSPPVSPGAGSIPSGDPRVLSDTTKTPPLSPPQQAAQALERGGQLNDRTAEIAGHVPGAVDAVSGAAEIFGDVLAKIDVLVEVLDKIGELHPYLKLATSILSLTVKPIIEQVARDKRFQELLEGMSDVYELATREFDGVAKRQEKPATRQMKLLQKITVESEKCAGFIQKEYDRSFVMRAMHNVLSGSKVDEIIDDYNSAFAKLRTKWHEAGDHYQATQDMLKKLPRVPHAGHTTQRACLENTRTAVLQEIDDWINNAQSPRVLFVLGVAGSGKSSIAHTVAEACDNRLQLGSFLSFEKGNVQPTPQLMLGTIAYNLAQSDEGYCDRLFNILKDDPKLADSGDIQKDQWVQLIVGPAASMSSPGRVVIIIDAFDECPETSDGSRQRLLDCLARHAAGLPNRFRILVTSRPLSLHEDSEAMTAAGTLDLSQFPAADDIRLYVRSQLPLPEKGGLSDSQCDDVADASDGLFQWAATACRFLRERLAGTTMSAKFTRYLDQLVHGVTRSAKTPNGLPSLDALYNTVLCATFDLEDEHAMTNFRSVVATMLCAKKPLPIDVLHLIYERALPSSPGVVKSVLGSMGVVLEGVSSPSSPVRPMHLSFREFLLDASRSGSWHIPEAHIAHGHRILALAGLRIMASDLRFNMHSLPSSLSSGDEERERKPCPHPTLAYIIPNLYMHLRKVLSWGTGTRNRNLFRVALRRLLYNKLLFWMEWSSIHRGLRGMGAVLELASRMLKGKDRRFAQDADLLRDRLRCTDDLTPPHVYLSGLAFAPAKSPVRQHFMPHFRGIPTVRPLRDSWDWVNRMPWSIFKPCLAWSTDGRYIRETSGFQHRCWDARTGDAVDVPPNVDWRCTSLESADGRVNVTFSLVDWELVVNVERSLIACPANTTPVLFTIKTGDYGDNYMADVSPDGNWLVIVDSINCLRLWDLRPGLQAREPVPECIADRQRAATFSPDSREVVSSGIGDYVHYVFPIDQGTAEKTVRWGNANFKPQPQTDDNGERFPDGDLRCTKPDTCIPFGYDHLICQRGVRLVLDDRLTVDYTNAYYGTEWTRCYAGTIEAEEREDEYAGVDVEMEESPVESSGSDGETDESEAGSSGSDGETDAEGEAESSGSHGETDESEDD